MAMLHGVLMGIAGVLIFGFLLNVSNRLEVKSDEPDKEIAVNGPVSEKDPVQTDETGPDDGKTVADSPNQPSVQLFALQHGVFTSDASAKEFISADPALQKAAVVPAAGQYFIWSEIGVTEEEVKKNVKPGETFVKSFRLSGVSCTKGDVRVPEFLKETELQKLNFDDSVNSEELPAQWRENIAAVTAFSKEMKVVRAQLLAHYTLKNDCFKIEF